ncbi:NAD(P)/FAD-dependent oxidoreductase [Amycolatopsis sp. lyj-346]|uniref:NAD(P)/FAD-dependent oxidoreductase n=1 Tax=Amycolatopsis sp. lyj-346 TaxID=2789289 RepID=UPI00397C6127
MTSGVTLFPDVDHDVVIAGGGLAGLCLAKQLKDAIPGLSVLVCERTTRPLPKAAFKVGESTVEIGAYYLSHVVGLHDHLEGDHLEKLGLRYFYGGKDKVADEAEFGVRRFLPAKSYQLDRGALEQHLRAVAAEEGATVLEGVRVLDIGLGGEDGHVVSYQAEDGGEAREVRCRWVVDATGRRRIIQRRLDLTKRFPRAHNAVWFRLDGRLDIDTSVAPDETVWHERVNDPRWNSTNHFMFEGGWVWVIPLAPNQTSVGIVTAAHLHEITTMNRLEKAMDFVSARVPELDAAMRAMPVLDFHVLKDYSHSSAQVFSERRWACVGEAGVFADPYYSVGSNLIAYANGFVTKMISDDLAGEFGAEFVRHANRWFLSLSEGLTNNIQVSYPFHHNPVLMALKTVWDYYVGWSFSDPQYYEQTFLSIPASSVISGLGGRAVATQAVIMQLLLDWSGRYRGTYSFDYIDYYRDVPTLARLFEQNLPESAPRPFTSVLGSIRTGLDRIEELALVIFFLAVEDVLPEHLEELRSRGWLNVSALSLDPQRWESDGLYEPKTQPRTQELQLLEKEMRGLFRVSAKLEV